MAFFIQRSQGGVYKLHLGLKTQQGSSAQPRMPGLTDLLSSKMSQVKNAEQVQAILRETCDPHLELGKVLLQAIVHPHVYLLSKMGKKTSPRRPSSLQRKTSFIFHVRHQSLRSAADTRHGQVGRQPAQGIKVTLLLLFSHEKTSIDKCKLLKKPGNF